jgi:integrase
VGLLPANPMDRVVLPKAEKKEIRALDKQGLSQLLGAVSGTSLFPLFVTAAATGRFPFRRLKQSRLDQIDQEIISSYVQVRRAAVSAATLNRELATLRKLLRLAQEWRLTQGVPRIRMLPGERVRDFVLTYQQETLYLEMAPLPLHDVASLILDTGLRIGEALGLEWADFHFEPLEDAKFGYLQVRGGKSRNARRALSLTNRVQRLLESKRQTASTKFVFTNEAGDGPSPSTRWNRSRPNSEPC